MSSAETLLRHFGTSAEVSVRHFGTSAEVSRHFGHAEVSWVRTSAGPKCLGSEVSWVRSVLGPKCLYTVLISAVLYASTFAE